MNNIVQKIVHYARKVVLETKHSEISDSESVRKFVKIFSGLTLEDLNLRPNELQFVPRIPKRFQAPCSFVNVFVDENLSLQLFGLRDRLSRIPPHDHPSMHGFIKCVHGSVKIKSFNLLPDNDIKYLHANIPDIVKLKVKPTQLKNLGMFLFLKFNILA